MDIHNNINSNRNIPRYSLLVNIHDKRNDFSFKVMKYPLVHSLIPRSIPYGVFLGQLHRGYRLCNNRIGFVEFAIKVTKNLISNGCILSQLLKSFKSFVFSKFHTTRDALIIIREFKKLLSKIHK